MRHLIAKIQESKYIHDMYDMIFFILRGPEQHFWMKGDNPKNSLLNTCLFHFFKFHLNYCKFGLLQLTSLRISEFR